MSDIVPLPVGSSPLPAPLRILSAFLDMALPGYLEPGHRVMADELSKAQDARYAAAARDFGMVEFSTFPLDANDDCCLAPGPGVNDLSAANRFAPDSFAESGRWRASRFVDTSRPMHVGHYLREAMAQEGAGVGEMARRLDWGKRYLVDYLKGERPSYLDDVRQVSCALWVDQDELVALENAYWEGVHRAGRESQA